MGCINRDFNSGEINNPLDFLYILYSRIKHNHGIGLGITTLEIPQNFSLPVFDDIEDDSDESRYLLEIFMFVRKTGHRVMFFLPSQFFMGSQIPEVVDGTKRILANLSVLLDQIGIHDPSIVLRVGSAYGNRKNTMERFCENVNQLDPRVIEKLSVCNDEKPSLFSVTDLLSGVFYSCKLPIVFRILPHQFNTGGLSIREALFLAVSTWPDTTTPVFVHSESCEIDENGIPISPSPSDFLKYRVPTFGLDIDIILDTPAEEKACLRYKSDLISLKPMVINKIDKK